MKSSTLLLALAGPSALVLAHPSFHHQHARSSDTSTFTCGSDYVNAVLDKTIPDASNWTIYQNVTTGKTAVAKKVNINSAQCEGRGFPWRTECDPGSCECMGGNGCWCYSDGTPCMCQCDPSLNMGELSDCTTLWENCAELSACHQ